MEVEFLSDQELANLAGESFAFDIECYPNLFLVVFTHFKSGKVTYLELSDTESLNIPKLRWIAENLELIGFNSSSYDLPVLWAAIEGLDNDRLKALTNYLIQGENPAWKAEKEFGYKIGESNHIDLFDVAPSAPAMCGLKQYAARMGYYRLQDLPIHHTSWLNEVEKTRIRLYCFNDTFATCYLYSALYEAVQLRRQMGLDYGVDLRSLSDAQIAERLIGHEIAASSGVEPRKPNVPGGTTFRFQNPAYMQFYSPGLQDLHRRILETTFTVDQHGKVHVLTPDLQIISATNLWSVTINRSTYRLGIGGLHSSESKQSYFTNDEYVLLDRDVASYYPSIILNQRLFPVHIGPEFLRVYQDIVTRRLQAKKDGDKVTAESLKICINGCFGKLGSKWSIFYSPDLLIQVTLTGQLSLLMLIEMLEWYDIHVVSANTDGIVIRCPQVKLEQAQTIFKDWEQITGFVTEETRYKSIHSRDVNNYIAIGQDGKIKAKGAYVNKMSMKEQNKESLAKNPIGQICSEAVMRFLQTCKDPHPITIEQTIKGCKDITKFLFVRRVNGGAEKDGVYLGRIIRWYMRKHEFGFIKTRDANAAGIKSMVPDTVGACPLMTIDQFPSDIDYEWYIRHAFSILEDIGFNREPVRQLELFES